MLSKFVLISNCLRLGRPYYVMPVVAIAVAGYFSPHDVAVSIAELVCLSVAFFLLGASCWTINEIADNRQDVRGKTTKKWGIYISGGTKLISDGFVSRRDAFFSGVLFALVALGLLFTMNLKVFTLGIIFVSIGLIYSIEPFRLKRRGFVGLAVVSVACGFLPFCSGWVLRGNTINAECVFLSFTLTVIYFGFEGVAHLVDEDQDINCGDKTIVVSMGSSFSKKLFACCQFLPLWALICFHFYGPNQLVHSNGLFLGVLIIFTGITAFNTAMRSAVSRIITVRLLGVPVMIAVALSII